MSRIVHCFPQFQALGGVHSLLQLHREHDEDHDLQSKFIIGWEPQDQPQPTPRVFFLAINPAHSIRQLRHRFQTAIERTQSPTVVYHAIGGLELTLDLDHAHRRLLVLHVHTPETEDHLCRLLPWIDAILCPSPASIQTLQTRFPGIDPQRIRHLPIPVHFPESAPNQPPLQDRPMVLGCAGRLLREGKRLDRLPPLIRDLKRTGLPVRLELLGEGPAESWLRKRLPASPHCHYHGRKSGADYHRILGSWDAQLSFSESETGPITILEGMAHGVIPILPNIPCLARDLIAKTAPTLLHPGNSTHAIINTLHLLHHQPHPQLVSLRAALRERTRPLTPHRYLQTFAHSVQQVEALPRRSTPSPPRPAAPWDNLPFRWLFTLDAATHWIPRLLPKRTHT